MDDPDLFHNGDPMMGFNFINFLALSDFRPIHWPEIKMMIATTNMFKNAGRREIIWLRLAANMCMLNIYKTDVLESAFRDNYIQKVFKTSKLILHYFAAKLFIKYSLDYQSDYENLILLNQAIMTYKIDIQNIMPSPQALQAAANKLKLPFEYPLEGALLNVFGGDKYVKTGVKTKLYHHIGMN